MLGGRRGILKEPSAGAYWVVIPAYNEAATIRDVVIRTLRQCTNIIVVDDASSDGTDRVLAGLNVTVLRNEVNRGKAGSLVQGFEHALSHGAVGVITLDADGQHAPEEILSFIGRSLEDPNVFFVGVRRGDQRRVSFWRYAANRIADFWIGWAAGRPMADSQSGFRLYPACLLREVTVPHGRDESFVYESEVLIEAARRGFAIEHVAVSVSPRSGPSPSHFRPVLDVLRITRMVAWKLLRRGMFPYGLFRVVFRRKEVRASGSPYYDEREVAGQVRKS